MENTESVKFPDDTACLFLAQGEGYDGPFRPSEVYRKLESKQISWIDHVYREQEGAWMRIADHPLFKALQGEPPKPKPTLKSSAPPPPPVATSSVKWFLYQNETQSGPYTESELKRLMSVGQVSVSDFVWCEGQSEWKPANEFSVFSGPTLSVEARPLSVVTAPKERRTAPRKPLVAQIYLTNQKEVIAGICRDISVGGMQVLTDSLPGHPGDQVQLNVLPPSNVGLKPFVASGVIVRILEDQRGFSFRFTQLSAEAKASIERYIQ